MHVPAYARELIQLRRARLAPEGDFVIVTNDWTLAKDVRAAGSVALVIRERDEPDLRGCYGLKVHVCIPQVDLLAGEILRATRSAVHGGAPSIEEVLRAAAMAESLRPHELEALEGLLEPIASACAAARAGTNVVCRDHKLQRRIWRFSAQQTERERSKARA